MPMNMFSIFPLTYLLATYSCYIRDIHIPTYIFKKVKVKPREVNIHVPFPIDLVCSLKRGGKYALQIQKHTSKIVNSNMAEMS